MKYQTYTKYKPSGVEWIGNVPFDWEAIKLKRISRIETGNTPSMNDDRYYNNGDFPWIKPDELGSLKLIIDSKTKLNSDGRKLSRRIPKNSILICCIGSVGKIGIAGVKLATNQQINSVIPDKKKFNHFFAKYILLASEEKIKSIGNSNVVAIVNKTQQGEIFYSLPSLFDQNKIANFLDLKTKQIDGLIKKDKRLIELLKEKRIALINKAVTKGLDNKVKLVDSGVDWIGEIPEGWGVRKLKFITKQIIDGTHFTPEYIENGVPFLRVTDIQENKINLNNVKYISEEASRLLNLRCNPKNGDLLLSKNGTIGIPKIVDWDYKFSIFVSLCLIKVRMNIDINFLKYFFLSNVIKEQIFYRSKTTSVTNLHLDQIQEFDITLPRIEEQKNIIKYLDFNTEKIDKHIKKVKKRIKLLEEYKKSLIYNAVTGKIKV